MSERSMKPAKMAMRAVLANAIGQRPLEGCIAIRQLDSHSFTEAKLAEYVGFDPIHIGDAGYRVKIINEWVYAMRIDHYGYSDEPPTEQESNIATIAAAMLDSNSGATEPVNLFVPINETITIEIAMRALKCDPFTNKFLHRGRVWKLAVINGTIHAVPTVQLSSQKRTMEELKAWWLEGIQDRVAPPQPDQIPEEPWEDMTYD